MKIVTTIAEMKETRHGLPEPVGFVPTMGYFHGGHLSLIKRARKDNLSVVVSIFVNPTQFGPDEDFHDYPCDTERDLVILRKEDVDCVFMPSANEMYPSKFFSWIDVDGITSRLEGASRPGHFRGVATICAKLFNIIQPTRAYFGQKDAQQVVVIKKMVSDLNMNLKIVTLPTIREPDGLAMSSRNKYLDQQQRQAAVILYQALTLAEKLWSQGEKSSKILRREMIRLIEKQPLAKIDYISIADINNLIELNVIKPPFLVSLAIRFGNVRLIDNFVLE